MHVTPPCPHLDEHAHAGRDRDEQGGILLDERQQNDGLEEDFHEEGAHGQAPEALVAAPEVHVRLERQELTQTRQKRRREKEGGGGARGGMLGTRSREEGGRKHKRKTIEAEKRPDGARGGGVRGRVRARM